MKNAFAFAFAPARTWLLTSFAVVALLIGHSVSAAPGQEIPAEILGPVEQSHYIVERSGPITAYAFVDPQCPACQRLKELVREGATQQVEWRWIPVGFLGERSTQRSAELLREADRHGSDAHQAVRKNTVIAQQIGVRSVPTVIYQTPDGVVRAFVGGLSGELAEMDPLAAE